MFDLTSRNIAHLDPSVALNKGDFLAGLASHELAPGHALVMFVVPPWGTALDESEGLDLSRTEPPITQIIEQVSRRYAGSTTLTLRVETNGILLGTKGWTPR